MADERVRVRARDGKPLEWSREAARRLGTLKDLMDDALPPEDGVYPAPLVSVAALSKLRAICEDDMSTASLGLLSIEELARMIEDAIYLNVDAEAMQHIQRTIATRLAAKRGVDLRQLLGAADDFESEGNRMAALAEPLISPALFVHADTLGAEGPPALRPQPSLWALPVTDEAKVTALHLVDVGTLIELKGVSRSWQGLARHVLFSRLCHREGRPAPEPSQLSEVADVDAKMLHDAGRAREAARLPGLERLHWDGWQVDIAAVRAVDLGEEDEEEAEDEDGMALSRAAAAALRSCITGEGIPPTELLIVAIVCAGSGDVCGIPLGEMRTGSPTELDLSERDIGPMGAKLLACLMLLAGSLTSVWSPAHKPVP